LHRELDLGSKRRRAELEAGASGARCPPVGLAALTPRCNFSPIICGAAGGDDDELVSARVEDEQADVLRLVAVAVLMKAGAARHQLVAECRDATFEFEERAVLGMSGGR
jgi:hypothetical protein